MMKIGLLGGTGNVGRYALEYLAGTGKFTIKVASHGITASALALENVKFTELDVNDNSVLGDYILKNDMIVNLIPSAVRSGASIARMCAERGVPLVDAGTAEDYEKASENCIYSAGAIPGFSAPLAVYAAKDFDQVSAFTHICSMSGVFSFGAAYDYLEGVVGSLTKGSIKQIPVAEIPFVGTGSLTSYSDRETAYVCHRLGAQGEHFMSFGGKETSSILKSAAMTFNSDKLGSAKKLVKMSKIYNIKANEHFAFIIEVNGTKNGKDKTLTLVLKADSAQAVTGICTGLCAEMAAENFGATGVFSFSEFAETSLYNRYMPYFIEQLRNSSHVIMLEIFDMTIDELNEESSGEI